MEFLKNTIESAQRGREGSVTLLRQICCAAVEAAPTYDLIAISQYIYYFGREVTIRE